MTTERSFVRRLRERKLVQWALAYLAGAFVLLQVLDLAAQPFAWPELVLRAAWVVLAVGFPAALVLAWYHGEKGQQRASGIEVLMLAALLAIAGAGVALVAGRGAGSPTTSAAEGEALDSVPEHASVVVLPFADLSPAGDQEYFSDGLTEEILNALVRIPGLRVPARTTSFAFKGRNVPVPEIARQLGVAHVLEGSVRRAGDRLRITAQLVDARNDRHLWSETYDRDLADVFAVQEEIARAVTAALEVRLAGGAESRVNAAAGRIVATGTADSEAYELYLRGLHAWNRRSGPALHQAARYFEQALERDSSFARGWAGLALTYVLIPEYTDTLADRWLPRVRLAAGRALAVDSSLAEAYTALGYAHALEWDIAASELEFRRALAVNPSYATAHQWFSSGLSGTGRIEEALPLMERARDLDPLSFIINANLADQYLFLGRLDDAVIQYERALELNPDGSPDYQAAYAVALVHAGRKDDALRQADLLLRRPGGLTVIGRAQVGWVLARTGRLAEAEAIADELEQLARQRYVSPAMRAFLQAGLERYDRALTLLEEGQQTRDPNFLYYAAKAPAFEPIRADPRYVRMFERLRRR